MSADMAEDVTDLDKLTSALLRWRSRASAWMPTEDSVLERIFAWFNRWVLPAAATFAVLGIVVLGLLGILGHRVPVAEENTFADLIGVLITVLLGGWVYLLPTNIAARRHHRNAAAIAALNILLGWSVLGWAGALVWALTKPKE